MLEFKKVFSVLFLSSILLVDGAWSTSVFPTVVASSAVDPFVGTWMRVLGGRPEGMCQEVYQYLPSGRSEESSGSSRTKSVWAIEGGNDPTDFRRLRIEIQDHNGDRDCTGSLPPVLKKFSFRLRLHPTSRWAELCPESDLGGRGVSSCIVFWRVGQ